MQVNGMKASKLEREKKREGEREKQRQGEIEKERKKERERVGGGGRREGLGRQQDILEGSICEGEWQNCKSKKKAGLVKKL